MAIRISKFVPNILIFIIYIKKMLLITQLDKKERGITYSYEYRSPVMIFAVLILGPVITWTMFALIPDILIFCILEPIVVIIASYYTVEGIKKHAIEIDDEEIKFFKSGVLRNSIPINELKLVTYVLEEATSHIGGGVSKSLSFERTNGKSIKIRFESMRMARHPHFDAFAEFVEALCQRKKIEFIRKITTNSKGMSTEDLDNLYKHYTSPRVGNLKKWRKTLRRQQMISTITIITCILFLLPSFLENINPLTKTLLIIGLFLIIPACIALSLLFNTWFNLKPEKDENQEL